MPRTAARRPSPSLVIALLALFVALDGPSHARNLIKGSEIRSSTLTSRHVKNGSLKKSDLGRRAVRSLQRTPVNSVTSAAVRDGSLSGADIADRTIAGSDIAPNAVGPGKIFPGAVQASELSDRSVDSGAVIDGSLTAPDVARFAEAFMLDFPPVPAGACAGENPEGLAPQAQNIDIGDDVIVGTPPANWPDALTFAIRRTASAGNRLRIVACNPTGAEVDPPLGRFRYAVLAL